MKVVITVPHTVSDMPGGWHFRDVLAPSFARKLNECIPSSVLIFGDEKREVLDLNREESRDSHFRSKIRDEMSNGDVLIDVHSFDNSSPNNRTPYDVVLLYNPDHSDLSFHKRILDSLKDDGFIASIFYNEYGCDIINEFQNRTTVLIEINENLDEDKVDAIAKSISKSLSIENPKRTKYRLTIEDMKDYAKSKGGECLSEIYVNSRTPLRWRCSEGVLMNPVENPMNRWQVYDSNMPPNEKHPYNQIAHKYDSTNLNMQARDTRVGTFDFLSSLYEDNVITVKMDGEFNIFVYDTKGSPVSTARGKKGPAPTGISAMFSNVNTLKWDFPVLKELENIFFNAKFGGNEISQIVLSGELLVKGKDGEILRGGSARTFVGGEENTHYYIFDIISVNGQAVQGDYVSRLELIKEIIGKSEGNRFHIVYWKKGGKDVAKDVWEHIIVPQGHEGLVVRSVSGGSVVKVKIVHPLDLLVVGYKEGSGRLAGSMGALLVSLRDDVGVYRFNAAVGTGFSDMDRRWWKTELDKIDTGQTKIVSGETFKLVDPEKSKVIEIECNEFNPQQFDAYKFENGKWDFIGMRFTHIIQKPRMIRIREDKTNTLKALRMEQIPNFSPDNVFEVDVTDAEIEEHNKQVFQILKDDTLYEQKKKEYKKKKDEFQKGISAGKVMFEDAGVPMSPDFVKRAFVEQEREYRGWRPFDYEKPIQGVKIKMPEVPDISVKYPRIGAPVKFPELKWDLSEEEETTSEQTPIGPVPTAPTGGDLPPLSPPTGGDVLPTPPPVKLPEIKKIVTGDKTSRGKDIIVTYYPKPIEKIPMSKLGVTCSCPEFVMKLTCLHVKDETILKQARENPYKPIRINVGTLPLQTRVLVLTTTTLTRTEGHNEFYTISRWNKAAFEKQVFKGISEDVLRTIRHGPIKGDNLYDSSHYLWTDLIMTISSQYMSTGLSYGDKIILSSMGKNMGVMHYVSHTDAFINRQKKLRKGYDVDFEAEIYMETDGSFEIFRTAGGSARFPTKLPHFGSNGVDGIITSPSAADRIMQNIITNMNVSITPSGAVPSGAVPTPTFTNDYSPFTTLLSEIPEEERNNYVGRKGIAIGFDETEADSSLNGFFPNGTSVNILKIEPDCVRVNGIDKHGGDGVWHIGLDKLLVIPESDSSKPESPESTEPKSKKTTKYIEPIEYPPITVDFSGAIWNP